MTQNKKESKETKKVGNEYIPVEKELYHKEIWHEYAKSELPGVVDTKSLGEIKKPIKSDKSHIDDEK